MTTKSRFYLNCPYAEKDDAKDLGAEGDQGARKWFVPDDIDPELFRKWWPEEVAAEVRRNLDAGVPLVGPECAIPLQTAIENLKEIPLAVKRWHTEQTNDTAVETIDP